MKRPVHANPSDGRLVFVDLDQTLLDYDKATRQAIAAFTSTDRRWSHLHHETVATAWLGSRRQHTLDGSRPLADQRRQRLTVVATHLQVENSPTLIDEWVDAITSEAIRPCRPYSDVDEFLAEVDVAGVITNGSFSNQQAKLAAAGLNAIAPIISSVENGYAKPSPELYFHAAAELGAQPNRCLMIGDSRTNDYDAALTAGYAGAAIVDRSANPSPGTHPTLLTAFRQLKESTP